MSGDRSTTAVGFDWEPLLRNRLIRSSALTAGRNRQASAERSEVHRYGEELLVVYKGGAFASVLRRTTEDGGTSRTSLRSSHKTHSEKPHRTETHPPPST